jgi:hypothetical protein
LFKNLDPDAARFLAGPAVRAITDQHGLTSEQKNARVAEAWTVMTTVDPIEAYRLMTYSHAFVLNNLCGEAGYDALVEAPHGMLPGAESPMKQRAASSYVGLHRSFCQNVNTFLRLGKLSPAPSATLAATQAKTTIPPADQAVPVTVEPMPDRAPPATSTPAAKESKTPPIANGSGAGTARQREPRPAPSVASIARTTANATDPSGTRTGNTPPRPRNIAGSNPETVKNHEFRPAPARAADHATPAAIDVGRSPVTPATYRDSLMATSAAYVAGTTPGTGANNLARMQTIDAAGIPRDFAAVAAGYVAQPRHRLGDPTPGAESR